ncbi:hypothetical protein VOLCADRAFT_98148 [Volvox carteri f. nagariensis]|uniref:Uncharacterized protein n=1 Tax=Volvox carteri f. nagariensis TaxID=3068 RepID=D8UEK4_VOLCA|nr:uncharacterized protein VOLCADRAFT_98148 [Volvox carteri f. nagariensis]EFJ41899.1 hypothetical protein VOLCADRAFT_98148 [Volvox carteri f. nagariensis]|eukprot:XP_002957097.1 hypothetical protein VOLCADRAFT_98148 [Volvox carteri f. nagariensis]
MNTATLGASSELGSETSHEAKKLLGPAAYLVKAPASTPATAIKAAGTKMAGGESGSGAQWGEKDKGKGKGGKRGGWKETVEQIHEQVLNLTAGNSRQLASMLQACPDALLDDGLLDITYVTGGAVDGATALVGEILARGLDAAQPSNVRILRVPWILLMVEDPDPDLMWPGNRDGEPVPPGRRFVLEALPRRVAMHLPESSRDLLTEGADPRVNAPVIAINRMRKGAIRAMLAQVRIWTCVGCV